MPDPPGPVNVTKTDGRWTRVPIVKSLALQCLWGGTPNAIWAGGSVGTLFRYDGQWIAQPAIERLKP